MLPDGAFYRRSLCARIRAPSWLSRWTLCVLLASGLDPARLLAQSVEESEASITAAGADHFARAQRAYEQRHYRDALREFELARDAVPSAELWYNIARCHEALGEWELAISRYELYLRDRVDAVDAKQVRERIGELRRELSAQADDGAGPTGEGRLRIDVGLDGTLVSLDGTLLGAAPVEEMIGLSPGRHRIDASHPGYLPARAEVSVLPGTLTAAYLDLAPAPGVGRQRQGHTGPATWVLGSLAVVALASSAVLAAVAAGGQAEASRSEYLAAAELALGGGVLLGLGAVVAFHLEADPAVDATSTR